MLLFFSLVCSHIQIVAQPTFSKSFAPSTIGLGSTSTLTFVITNAGQNPVTDLVFTDVLPAGVVIANPPNGISECGQGIISAIAGASTMSFTDGTLGANSSCTISVNVTSSTIGTHLNVSGALTSSAGNSGTAQADLTIAADRPGFTKIFSPSSVDLGEAATLTFTIDNTANNSLVSAADFIDNLPLGLQIASPSNVQTTCGTPGLPPHNYCTEWNHSSVFFVFREC